MLVMDRLSEMTPESLISWLTENGLPSEVTDAFQGLIVFSNNIGELVVNELIRIPPQRSSTKSRIDCVLVLCGARPLFRFYFWWQKRVSMGATSLPF